LHPTLRNIIKAVCAVTCAVIIPACATVAPPEPQKPLEPETIPKYLWIVNRNAPVMSSVISQSDWLTWRHATYDRVGIRYILSQCAASGIRRVYYRTFGGGLAQYPSDLPDARMMKQPETGVDYSGFDHLRETVEFGHRLGLEVCVWYTFLEENHAWPDHLRSAYLDNHPGFWEVDASGNVIDALPSFAYPEYRRQRVALAQEVLRKYPIDGLMLDFERRGSPGRGDNAGYSQLALEEFRKKTGSNDFPKPDDEAWRRHRAEYINVTIRDIRTAIERQGRKIPLVAMVPSRLDGISSVADIAAWQAGGLFDRTCLIGHGKAWGWCGSPREAFELQQNLKGEKGFVLYVYKGSADEIRKSAAEANELGLNEIIWFETGPLDFNNLWDLVATQCIAPEVRIKREFAVSELPSDARLRVDADCSADVFVNGKEVAAELTGTRTLSIAEHIQPGMNAIAIRARPLKGASRPGLAAVIETTSPSGQVARMISDESWLAAETDVSDQWTTSGADGDGKWRKSDAVGMVGLWPRMGRKLE